MPHRHLIVGFVALLAFTWSACSSSGTEPFPYANCGNGTIDPGETCDNGPPKSHNCDTCACTQICQLAFCGDGFVWSGVEQCDTFNLNNKSCESPDIGFAAGTLSCVGCQLDTSQCGPRWTPTATPSPTLVLSPTVTPTPTLTPRPTPTPGGACIPDGRVPILVNFATTGSTATASISIALVFPADAVGLPATGVDTRISGKPPRTQPVSAQLSGSTLRATVTGAGPATFPPGRLFVVDFDRCTGGPVPEPSDFICRVEQCAVAGCTCSVVLP